MSLALTYMVYIRMCSSDGCVGKWERIFVHCEFHGAKQCDVCYIANANRHLFTNT